MATLQSPTDRQRHIAAQLRVSGVSWTGVARELKRNPRTVERWMTSENELWMPEYYRALRQLTLDVLAEAVMALRLDLRNEDDPKARRDSAAKLIRFAQTQLSRKGTKKGPLHSKSLSPTANRNVAEYIESLSKAEQDQLFAEAGYVPEKRSEALSG